MDVVASCEWGSRIINTTVLAIQRGQTGRRAEAQPEAGTDRCG